MNQKQLTENLEKLYGEPQGLSFVERLTLGRIIKQLKGKTIHGKELDELSKLYRQVQDKFQERQKKQSQLLSSQSKNVDIMTNFARKKVLGSITKSISNACVEHRLICQSQGNFSYTDKDGVSGNYSFEELSGLLWDKYDKKLVEMAGLAQANLFTLGITIDDIGSIVKKQLEVKV